MTLWASSLSTQGSFITYQAITKEQEKLKFFPGVLGSKNGETRRQVREIEESDWPEASRSYAVSSVYSLHTHWPFKKGFPGAVAGGARAAAQAPHPTNLPLSRLCTSRRVTKGDQEAAILNSVQGEEENFIENQKRDGNTDKSNFARGRRENEKDQLRNAASCNQGAR